MSYPETLQYQGFTIYLVDCTRMDKIAGKPTRVRYGIETETGVKVKLISYDFGSGVDWQAIEAANYLAEPLPVAPKVLNVSKEAMPRTRKPYVSKAKNPRGKYITFSSEEEKEAVYEERRLKRNAAQRAYQARQKALRPPKPPKIEKPMKVKKNKPAKPEKHQQFSLKPKERVFNPEVIRPNQPKVAKSKDSMPSDVRVKSYSKEEYLEMLEAERKQAKGGWHDSASKREERE